MNRLFLHFIFFQFFLCAAMAQPIQKFLNYGVNPNVFEWVCSNSSGQVGVGYTSNLPFQYPVMQHIDPLGNQSWGYAFVIPGTGSFHGVTTCPDGGFISTGFITDSLFQYSDMVTIKTDAAGTIQWANTYSHPDTAFLEGKVVISESSGSFLTASYTSYSFAGYDAILLIRLDTSGAITASNTIELSDSSGSLFTHVISDMVSTADGGAIISGMYSFDEPDWVSTVNRTIAKGSGYNTFVLKVDSSLAPQWANLFRSDFSQVYGYKIQQDLTGNYLVCGHLPGQVYPSAFIMVLDANGNMLNDFAFLDSSMYGMDARAMELISSSEVLMAGRNKIWRVDYQNGVVAWGKTIGQADSCEINTLCNVPPSGFACAGFRGEFYNSHPYIIRGDYSGNFLCEDTLIFPATDTTGIYGVPVAVVTNPPALTVSNLQLNTNPLPSMLNVCLTTSNLHVPESHTTVFPNPGNDLLHIQSSSKFHTVKIFTLTQQEVKRVNQLQTNDYKVDVSGLQKGVYIIITHGDEGDSFSRWIRN